MKKLILAICFTLTPILLSADVPTIMPFSGHLAENGVGLQGRYSVLIKILYGDDNTPTGFEETHDNVKFTNGYFKLKIGSVNTLNKDHLSHTNLKVSFTADGLEESFMDIESVPFAISAQFAYSSAEAQTINWKNITNIPLFTDAMIATINSSKVVGSIKEQSIVSYPASKISGQLQSDQIESIDASKIIGITPFIKDALPTALPNYSEDVNGLYAFNVQNNSINNETGTSITTIAEDGNIVGFLSSVKNEVGNGSVVVGSQSNHNLVLQQGSNDAVVISNNNLDIKKNITITPTSSQSSAKISVGGTIIEIGSATDTDVVLIRNGETQLRIKDGIVEVDTLRAKTVDAENFNQVDYSGQLSPPVGSILPYFGDPGQPIPNGYLFANGQCVIKSDYEDLHRLFQGRFGSCNSSATFRLPDLRGMFLRGWSGESGVDPDSSSRQLPNGSIGNYVGSIQSDATAQNGLHSPAHSHTGTSTSSGNHSHNITILSSGLHKHTINSYEDIFPSNISNSTNGLMYTSITDSTNTYTKSTSSTGEHSHSATISSSGNHTHLFGTNGSISEIRSYDQETRPTNISVMYLIKF